MLERKMVATLALGFAFLAHARPAEACGGCVHDNNRAETLVVAHRMAFSVSPQATTLWDQIEYAGEPDSFAWILPIKAPVTIGLSSDLLFETLEQRTQVTVLEPSPPQCPPHPCPEAFPTLTGTGTGTGIGSGTSTGTGTGVVVVAEEVVGPYETVQLSSTNPNALSDWLASHGYVVPADVEPVIAAYLAEGFDFLAMKLIPGQGIQSMRPVRVTTPGATLTLPLRMVAAGTGANTSVRLWVVGEGRYEPTNRPSLLVDPADVVWDFATSSSNFSQLKQAAFDASGGTGWLTMVSDDFLATDISWDILDTAKFTPLESGYGDASGAGAFVEATADLDTLFGGLAQARITRLDAELSRAGLVLDLDLGASADQATVSQFILPTETVNFPCPTYPPCPPDDGDDGSSFPAPGGDGSLLDGAGNDDIDDPLGGSSCAMGRGSLWDFAPPGLLLLLAALRLLFGRSERRGERRDHED